MVQWGKGLVVAAAAAAAAAVVVVVVVVAAVAIAVAVATVAVVVAVAEEQVVVRPLEQGVVLAKVQCTDWTAAWMGIGNARWPCRFVHWAGCHTANSLEACIAELRPASMKAVRPAEETVVSSSPSRPRRPAAIARTILCRLVRRA